MGAGARASHSSNKTKQKRYKTVPLTLASGPHDSTWQSRVLQGIPRSYDNQS